MHVSPDTAENPIQPPERFEGYHVGTDFEVGSDELNTDVPVYAICTGEIMYSGFAEGYGGLLTQECTINGEQYTILYGHLQLDSLAKKGAVPQSGDQIALLAPARSTDSDGNRKHLHLGVIKGWKTTEFRGYVQTEEELSLFTDSATLLPEGFGGIFTGEIQPYWKEHKSSEATQI